MPPHRERFALEAQLYRTMVIVVTMHFSACIAPRKGVGDLTARVGQRQGYRLVHDLLALLDVHDMVALVIYRLKPFPWQVFRPFGNGSTAALPLDQFRQVGRECRNIYCPLYN